MKIFLLRHADAVAEADTEEARQLSDKGLEQAARTGEFCARHDMVPAVILHSPLVRAVQTAEAFASEAKLERLISADWLSPGAEPSAVIDALKGFTEFESVLLVGHEPDFSRLAASMLGLGDAEALHLRKASLALIELEIPAASAGRLEFLVPSRLMKI